jgi:hypothetical protein
MGPAVARFQSTCHFFLKHWKLTALSEEFMYLIVAGYCHKYLSLLQNWVQSLINF